MATNSISVIKYDGKKSADLKRDNILTECLITDRKSVLFVDAGDFSFTVAFAALREFEKKVFSQDTLTECLKKFKKLNLKEISVWENITASRYKPLCPQAKHVCATLACKPEADLSEVKLKCVSSIAHYALLRARDLAADEDNIQLQLLKNIQFISLLCGPPVFHYGIDGLAIPAVLTKGVAVIWFQCPWIARRPVIPDRNTHTLVSGFLLKLADQIQPGVHICIGITKHIEYIKEYGLEGLLGVDLAAEPNSTPVLQKYEFIGADDDLVKKVLSFGYYHRSVSVDIHDYIFEDHVTLIFKKKE